MERLKGSEAASFISKNGIQILVLTVTTFITVINLYLASVLSPIKSDIRILNSTYAQTTEILNNHIDETKIMDQVPAQLTEINHRLGRIEKQLGIEF